MESISTPSLFDCRMSKRVERDVNIVASSKAHLGERRASSLLAAALSCLGRSGVRAARPSGRARLGPHPSLLTPPPAGLHFSASDRQLRQVKPARLAPPLRAASNRLRRLIFHARSSSAAVKAR